MKHLLFKYILPILTVALVILAVIFMGLFLAKSVNAQTMSSRADSIRSNYLRSNDGMLIAKQTVKNNIVSSKYAPQIVLNAFEKSIMEEINMYRKSVGFKPLNLKNTDFSKVRQNQIKSDWSHQKFYDLSHKYFGDKLVGEILAKDFDNATDMMNAWINSRTHNQQITYKYYSQLSLGCNKDFCAVNFY